MIGLEVTYWEQGRGRVLGRSSSHLSLEGVEGEETGIFDRYCEEGMLWVVAVSSGESGARDKAYLSNIPIGADWRRKIDRFFGGYYLISSLSRYR